MNFDIKQSASKVFSNELFWILVICFTVRNILYQFQNYYIYNTDSVTYYYAANQIFKGIIDPGRPPIYPILIKLFELINKDDPFKYLIYFQHTLSFLSIVPFYILSKGATESRILRILMTLTYGIYPVLCLYNIAILAESILISCLIGYLYIFSNYIKLPTFNKAISINIILFFLVMIKPVCLVLYGVIPIFWIIRLIQKKDLNLKRSILYSYLISVLLLIGYCGINKVQNNSFSISTVGHDNKFINVILSGAYKTIPDRDFVNTIDTTIYKGHYYTVYYLNNDHKKYHDGFEIFPLEFMSHVDMRGVYNIPSNDLGYSTENISEYIKQAASTLPYWTYIFQKIKEFWNFKLFYANGAAIYLIILLDFFIIIYFLVKKRKLNEFKTLNFLIGAALLCGFFLAGVNDVTYSRVLLPLLPFLIISFFNILDYIVVLLKTRFYLLRS